MALALHETGNTAGAIEVQQKALDLLPAAGCSLATAEAPAMFTASCEYRSQDSVKTRRIQLCALTEPSSVR